MLQRKYRNPVRKLCRQVVCIVVTAYFVQKFINDFNVTEMRFKSNFRIVMTEFLMLITSNAQFKIFFYPVIAQILNQKESIEKI